LAQPAISINVFNSLRGPSTNQLEVRDVPSNANPTWDREILYTPQSRKPSA
jgi:hypothetical protein